MKYLLAISAAAIGLMTFAGAASAATYCVGASSECTAGSEYPFTYVGLQAAIDHAETAALSPGSDDVVIAAGTIEFAGSELSVSPPSGEPLTISGAGSGTTILHSTTPNGTAVTAFGLNAALSINGLSVRSDGAQTGLRTGIDGNGATLSDIGFEVTSLGGNSGEGFTGGGECDDCTFALSGSGAEAGLAGGNMTIKRGRVFGVGDAGDLLSGFREDGGGALTVLNTTITGMSTALSTDHGSIALTNSVIDMGDRQYARGVVADNPNNGVGPVSATLHGSTVVGTGDSQAATWIGAATTAGAGETAQLDLRNVILLAKGTSSKDVVCHEGSNGTTSMTLYYMLYDGSRQSFDLGCDTYITSGNIANGYNYALSDIFISPATGDFRLKPLSPAIDSNDTTGNCAGTDVIGNPRCVGNIDYGAVEYQNYAPDVPVITAPATGVAGQELAFSATATDANDDPVTLDWNFGDGGGVQLTAPKHTFAGPGTYTVTVIANDGVRDSAAASAKVTISAGPPAELLPLPIAWFKLGKPTGKFKLAKKPKAFTIGAIKPKVGIAVDTNMSGPVTFTLVQVKGGYASGKKCVKDKPKTGKAKRCSLKLKGSQQLMVPSGISYLSFSGRWNKKSLKPGKYMLSNGGVSTTFTLAK